MPKIIRRLSIVDKLRQMFKYEDAPETEPWEIPEEVNFTFDVDLATADHKITSNSATRTAASGAGWRSILAVPSGKLWRVRYIRVTRSAGDGTFTALRFIDTSENDSMYIEDTFTAASEKTWGDKNFFIMEEIDEFEIYVNALTTDSTFKLAVWVDEYDIGRVR